MRRIQTSDFLAGTKIGAATTTVTRSSSTASSTEATTTHSTTASTTSTSSVATTSTASSTASATTTGGASAPVRPTSDGGGGSSSATTSRPSGYCPTGFYACSAVYGGGCCQTGRDCQVTSCPSTASTTVVSDGVTVVVPASDASAATATSEGSCAGGWTLCPSSGATAGCCPGGYSCGTASCFLATGSATASVAKELPGSGAVRGAGLGMVMMMMPGLVGFALGVVLA